MEDICSSTKEFPLRRSSSTDFQDVPDSSVPSHIPGLLRNQWGGEQDISRDSTIPQEKLQEWLKDGQTRLSMSCPSLPLAKNKSANGYSEKYSGGGRQKMSAANNPSSPDRKSSYSSDSNTADLESGSVDTTNVKIQINDITPSNSQEFLNTAVGWITDNSRTLPQSYYVSTLSKNNSNHMGGGSAHRTSKKSSKKELIRRQSWLSLIPKSSETPEKLHIQKSWSLSSLDSDAEDIFYDARDIPSLSLKASSNDKGSSQSFPDVREKQRSLSAGSGEDAFMSLCSQVPGAVHSMTDISTEIKEKEKKKKKFSPGSLNICKSPCDSQWLLAPRTPLQKSISTPSILTAQEINEEVHQRDEGRDSLFSCHRFSLHNVGNARISLMREEEEEEEDVPEEVAKMFLPQFTLAGLLRENLLGGGVQDSDEEKPFGKRKKRGSLFFRKKRGKDKDKESKKSLHQFVSICYSTAAVCDICSKPLANKLALRCENCMVTIHESSCKDHVPECKTKSKISTKGNHSPLNKEKSYVPTLQVPPGQIRYPYRYRHLLSPVSQSMINLANGKQFSSSHIIKEKKHSISNGSRSQSQINFSSTVADLSVKSSPPSSSKVISEEKEAEPIDDSNTNIMETNSASMESLDEGAQEISDVEDDSVLKLMDDEPEAWNATVDKKILKKLKDKDVKRQEAIYELIITEKHHCLTLKIMQKVFAHGMMKELHMSKDMVERIFPCLEDLIEVHTSFLRKLRDRQQRELVVAAMGDILLEQFQGTNAQQMKSAYGQFCSMHKEAVSLYKDILKSDRKFQSFIKKCCAKPVCKTRGIPECILLVTQRVTKYPLLIDSLIKATRDNKAENENLVHALSSIKEIITQIDAEVAEKEKERRLLEIYNKVDAKSTAFYKGKKFKKSDLLSNNRKLCYEGTLSWKTARGKTLDVNAVVLSDVIVFLQENNQKCHFASLDNKSGIVSLQKLLVREKAGQNSRGIYLISSNPNEPEMYELICSTAKEKKHWIMIIREAVEKCPDEDEGIPDESLEDHKLEEARTTKLKELFGLLYERDFSVAQICEEKMRVLIDMLELLGADTESFENLHYTHLLQKDEEETKQLLFSSLNNASRLANSLYASGANLSRSVSSAGEHQSDTYASPLLPKRAETFGGFDNSGKDNSSKVLILKKKLLQLKELSGEGSTSPDQEESPDISLGKEKHSQSSTGTNTPLPVDEKGIGTKEMLRLSTTSLLASQGKEQVEQIVELTHHLNILTCLLNHHFSNVESLRVQLTEMREKLNKEQPSGDRKERRSLYRPEHQLEELRNLQEHLSQERIQWQQERATQESEMNSQREELYRLQEHIRTEQENLACQKQLLQRKIDALQREGILLSPSLTVVATPASEEESSGGDDAAMFSQDLFQHRRTASFDLHHIQGGLMTPTTRQSWSGPAGGGTSATLDSWIQPSLSASNLPLTVSNEVIHETQGHLCAISSLQSQASSTDSATQNMSLILTNSDVNGLIGCQPSSSQILPLVLATTSSTQLAYRASVYSSVSSSEGNKSESNSAITSPVIMDTSSAGEQGSPSDDADGSPIIGSSSSDAEKFALSGINSEQKGNGEIFC